MQLLKTIVCTNHIVNATLHFKIYLYGNEKLNLDYKHGLTDEIFM